MILRLGKKIIDTETKNEEEVNGSKIKKLKPVKISSKLKIEQLEKKLRNIKSKSISKSMF
jgi:hypothetical protein